eukprot:maker-scaffold1179_size56971-snap-gene-0.18 protein:Tk06635 transcript:maker-scaffold1179_size56971-snap-gene-0.18-mRNA-1 annotation:"hypothetical protein DAPPUDRAFT_307138"
MKIVLSVIGSVLVVVGLATTLILTLRPPPLREEPNLPPKEAQEVEKEPITFDEYLSGKFSARTFSGQWWSRNEIQYKNPNGDLVLWDVETNLTRVLVSKDILSRFDDSRFLGFAPNNDALLLIASNVQSIWRHSFEANYIVYDSLADKEYPIHPSAAAPEVKLQYAAWADHSSQNPLVYIYQNDIYYRTNVLDAQSESRITDDGIVDTLYNGKPDWVYEEEVLSTNNAIYLSGEGQYLAFATFDDSMVREFHYTMYGEPSDPNANKYPTEVMVKYPKTGSPNPKVSFQVANLGSGSEPTLQAVIPPMEVSAFEDYIYSAAAWTREGIFSIIWMNRVQTESIVSECALQGNQWICTKVYDTQESMGWIDLFQPPVYKSSGQEMLLVLPNDFLQHRFRHLAKINILDGTTNFLTNGEFIVTAIVLWDEADGIVYFMGTGSGAPGARHLYSVADTGLVAPTCITCDLNMPVSEEPCLYSTIQLSPDARYYVHICSGPQVPEVALRDLDDQSKVLHVIESNEALKVNLANKAVAQKLFLEVDVANGFKAPVRLLVPDGYDPEAVKQYPMIVHVYGGPDSQEVDYRWSVDWGDFLASNYGVVYASIDGRGTGGQSNEFLFEVFRNMGTVEMEDQIAVTQSLAQIYPFLDSDRFGIWGWSYGGYATAMTLIQDTASVFTCGISVAPPTDWLFYDTIYTERYMGLPTAEDNMAGYDQGSILNKVEGIRGKKFMLNHGVADDNVHYQQSMMLIRALELANIHFEQFSYPENNHGIRNGVSRFLYTEFERFWGQCLDFTPPSRGEEVNP